MSKKRLIALILSIGIFLSLAATAFATGQPRRYNENSTVKGTISQSFYQVNAKTDGKNSGRLRQNGSNYLASTKSYTYTEILHYYYDKSSYNNPSVGIVKIN